MEPRFDFETVPEAPTRQKFKRIHKREVCRYWLTSSCAKGDACEFLHEYDQAKMPECRKGQSCGDPSCVLKHPTKSERAICGNYAAGFCSFGNSCPLRHELSVNSAPLVSPVWLSSDPAKQWVEERQKTQRSFRSAPCPYWKSDGWCPYFHFCAFRH